MVLEGKLEGQEGAPAEGVEAEGGFQEGRLLHSGAAGCPKERVEWMERREEGMEGR